MPKKQKPKISIISAITKNRGIGKNNKLLFEIPDDLKHFKKITSGHPVIMGERTYYSIGRPLPNRLNIVLSKNPDLQIEGAINCGNIEEAIKVASDRDKDEIFFIGGGMIYGESIKYADRLYLTLIDAEPEADTFFPDYSEFKTIVSEELGGQFEDVNYKYIILER